MGKRGRKPRSPEIAAKQGDLRAQKAIKDNQVAADAAKVAELTPPSWLTERAIDIWNQIVPIMRDLGTLSESDGISIGRYCRAVDDWLGLEERLKAEGLTYTTKEGQICAHPCVRMRNEREKQAQSFEDRFGLNPSSRLNLRIVRQAALRAQQDAKVKDATTKIGETPKAKGSVIDASRFFG